MIGKYLTQQIHSFIHPVLPSVEFDNTYKSTNRKAILVRMDCHKNDLPKRNLMVYWKS